MKLTGPQVKQLRDALLSAFPAYAPLEEMVRIGLNENLSAVAGEGILRDVVFALIRWAEAQGRITELVVAASEENPGNAALKEVSQQFALAAASPGEPERLVLKNVPFANVNAWLNLLSERKRAICRIEIPLEDSGETAYGTGFLINVGTVMTNYHVMEPVLDGRAKAAKVSVRFDYDAGDGNGASRGSTCRLARDWHVDMSNPEKLDYFLVRVSGRPGAERIGAAKATRGFLALRPRDFKAGEPIIILQHPSAQPLKLAIGSILKSEPVFVHYSANTLPGSSGSPCFNSELDCVALHYWGDAKANQGIRCSAILDNLRAKRLLDIIGDHA